VEAESGNRLTLHWTPDHFAAQDGSPGSGDPGTWHFTIGGSDGHAQFARPVELVIGDTNQAPAIVPLPLQLVREGDTLNFSLIAGDPDGDPVALAWLRDAQSPPEASFDAATGRFSWTPEHQVVDNLSSESCDFAFAFRASDGRSSGTQTVRVRVLDVNRPPQIRAADHRVLAGDRQVVDLDIVVRLAADGGALPDEGNFLEHQAFHAEYELRHFRSSSIT